MHDTTPRAFALPRDALNRRFLQMALGMVGGLAVGLLASTHAPGWILWALLAFCSLALGMAYRFARRNPWLTLSASGMSGKRYRSGRALNIPWQTPLSLREGQSGGWKGLVLSDAEAAGGRLRGRWRDGLFVPQVVLDRADLQQAVRELAPAGHPLREHLFPSRPGRLSAAGQPLLLAPGEQPRRRAVDPRRILTLLAIAGAVATLLVPQWHRIDDHRRYWTEDRPAVSFLLNELSPTWNEHHMRQRFAGAAVRCGHHEATPVGGRTCALEISAYNGVPAAFATFFFSGNGQLQQVSILVPWWARGRAEEALVSALGPPFSRQALPRAGVRLQGWRLQDDAAVFLNRDRPLNPLEWNAILWRSGPACRLEGCFTEGRANVGI